MAQTQNRIIRGKVVDRMTKRPLNGVNVMVLGQKYGASTNEQGIYSIKEVPEIIYKLQLSLIGFSS